MAVLNILLADGTFEQLFTGVIDADYVRTDATNPCTSTNLQTNLNADLLDGKHVGTSGDVVPSLAAANTWGADQEHGTNKITFRSGIAEINTLAFPGRLVLNGSAEVGLYTGGVVRAVMDTSAFDISAKQFTGGTLRLSVAGSGAVGTTTLGNDTFAPIGLTTIVRCLTGGKTGPANATVDLLWPIRVGTIKYHVMLLRDLL